MTLWVLVIGGVVIIGIVIWGVRPKDQIAPSTLSVTVAVNATATFTATLVHSGWFGTGTGPVAGTVTPTSRPTLFTTAPASGVAGASPLTISVTGVLAGTGVITLNGTATSGTIHDAVSVAVVVVTPPPS